MRTSHAVKINSFDQENGLENNSHKKNAARELRFLFCLNYLAFAGIHKAQCNSAEE